MSFPIDLHIGALTIPSHMVFDLLSVYVGWQVFSRMRKEKGDVVDDDARWSLIIGAAVGALVGSRLLAALESPSMFLHPPHALYYVMGKTVVGGIAGGILGVEIAKKVTGITRKTGDLFAYALLAAIGVGRVGCFLTGVSDRTVGLPSNLPWAFDQGDGIARHPTSLYEILFVLALMLLLRFIEKRYVLREGALFRLSIIGYFSWRFFAEFLKPGEPLIFALTAIQWVAGGVALYYLVSFVRTLRPIPVPRP